MLKNVGFHAGGLLAELGPAVDVAAFFMAITHYVNDENVNGNLALVSDRLFRRTIALEQLDELSEKMSKIKVLFQQIDAHSVNWKELGTDSAVSALRTNQKTLADVFERYFSLFFESVDSARAFNASWNRYLPLKLGFTDVPDFMIDKKRTASDYESLTGPPFWMPRPPLA